MKELKHFNKLVSRMNLSLNEGIEIDNSNDYGLQQNLRDLDFISGVTYLEKSMAEIVGDVMAYGYTTKKADDMIKDAIKELVATKVISEVPTEDSTDGAKTMWVSMAKPRILAQLKLTGKIL